MGVYICFGQNIHNANIKDAINFNDLGSFKAIHDMLETQEKLLVFLTKAGHKIKKKAEQQACDQGIRIIGKLNQ